MPLSWKKAEQGERGNRLIVSHPSEERVFAKCGVQSDKSTAGDVLIPDEQTDRREQTIKHFSRAAGG